MQPMNELIHETLEIAAEREGDLTPAVYHEYFERCPESAALMSHIDDIVRGRMLEEVLLLVMLESLEGEAQYLDFEVNNHRLAYSVEPHMYGNLLEALRQVVRNSAGDDWKPEYDAAWDKKIEALLAEISRRQAPG